MYYVSIYYAQSRTFVPRTNVCLFTHKLLMYPMLNE